MSFHVMGTGSALPARQVTNDELSEFLDTNDAWIAERTGVKSRPICTTETLDDLSIQAARAAMESAGVTPEQLDYVICHHRLGGARHSRTGMRDPTGAGCTRAPRST